MRKSLYALVLGVSSVFALSACGAVDLTPDTRSNPAEAAPAAPAAEAGPATPAAEAAPAGPVLRAAQTALGSIVTNAKGFPLYRFDADVKGSGRSACYGACVKNWPAYRWSADLKLEGVDQKLIGKIERTDGITQLTIAGWPTYTYDGDTAPGEWNGHGQAGKWWVITPEGRKAGAPAGGGPAAKPSKTDSGYSY